MAFKHSPLTISSPMEIIMILNIATLSTDWTPLSFTEPHTLFPALTELEKSGEAHFQSPLVIDLSVRMKGGQVEIKGSLRLSIEQGCGRCLKPFLREITPEIDLHFVEAGTVGKESTDGEEVELTEEDITREIFHGDKIDLTAYLQEEVVMALPLNPICSESCKGLCLECGKDLNGGDCGCDTTTCHPAFAKLKLLKGGK